MLRKIHLSNFKCYRDATLNLSQLTVFSGVNAVGKSTVIQALNLLRQVSANRPEVPCGFVRTDGPLVSFGTVNDLVNIEAPRDETTSVVVEAFGDLDCENASLTLGRLGRDDPDNRMSLVVKDGHLPSDGDPFGGKGYGYLSANRISPEDDFFFNDSESFRVLNVLGNRGEFSVGFLCGLEGAILPIAEMKMTDEPGRELFIQQLGLWMGGLGRKVTLQAKPYEDIRRAALKFSFVEDGVNTPWYSPRNVGFGLTHSLPIFALVLSRGRDSIVVIENPESHLHPKAQVFMGRFLSKAASCGIQVIVETHSDHILNGIRLSVKQGALSPEQVQLNFMAADAKQGVKVFEPRVLPSGAIDVWPSGFFDEYENVAADLI